MLDPSVWFMIYTLKHTVSEHNTMQQLYEVILPHFVGMFHSHLDSPSDLPSR